MQNGFGTLTQDDFLHKLRNLEAEPIEYWTENYPLNLFFILQEMNLFALFLWCHVV